MQKTVSPSSVSVGECFQLLFRVWALNLFSLRFGYRSLVRECAAPGMRAKHILHSVVYVIQEADEILGYAMKFGPQHSSFLAGLDKFYSHHHRTHDGAHLNEANKSSDDDSDDAEFECYRRGVCCHTQRGQMIWCIRNVLHFTIKQEFPFRSDAREKILKKLIIMELAGELNEDFRDPDLVDFYGLEQNPKLFWHIYVIWSPTSVTVQDLCLVPEEELVLAVPLGPEIALKVSGVS